MTSLKSEIQLVTNSTAVYDKEEKGPNPRRPHESCILLVNQQITVLTVSSGLKCSSVCQVCLSDSDLILGGLLVFRVDELYSKLEHTQLLTYEKYGRYSHMRV